MPSSTDIDTRIKLWTDALRSGDYQQTTGELHNRAGFCCLGVACDVFIKAGGALEEVAQNGCFHYRDTHSTESAVLPNAVRDWLGLRTGDGAISQDLSLASENDNGASFEEIADLIEAQPEGLSEGLFA